MTTSNEPLFTQVGVLPPSASGTSAYDHIEGKEYGARTEQADECLADAPVRVPLYLIAAAALLG